MSSIYEIPEHCCERICKVALVRLALSAAAAAPAGTRRATGIDDGQQCLSMMSSRSMLDPCVDLLYRVLEVDPLKPRSDACCGQLQHARHAASGHNDMQLAPDLNFCAFQRLCVVAVYMLHDDNASRATSTRIIELHCARVPHGLPIRQVVSAVQAACRLAKKQCRCHVIASDEQIHHCGTCTLCAIVDAVADRLHSW